METLDLTYFFKTKAQANDFISRIAAVSGKVYGTKFDLEKELLEEFGMQKRDKFMTLLRTNNVNPEKADALKAFFTTIQKYTEALPTLTLTIAFEPKEKTLQALSEWFMMNIKKQMLFEIIVDPKVIGGSTISYRGQYADFSIKPIFEKLVKETLNPSTIVTDKTASNPIQSTKQIPVWEEV